MEEDLKKELESLEVNQAYGPRYDYLKKMSLEERQHGTYPDPEVNLEVPVITEDEDTLFALKKDFNKSFDKLATAICAEAEEKIMSFLEGFKAQINAKLNEK